MKFIILTVILLSGFMPMPQDDFKLELGFVLPQKYLDKQATFNGVKAQISTHISQMRPFFNQKVQDINYLIGFDEKSREIMYIWTIDKNFKTEEGLKVGDCMKYSESQVINYYGLLIHGPKTKDDWQTILQKKEDCWMITGFSKGN